MDVAKWRANKAAAANSQTLEKAAMNKYLEKIAAYTKEYQDRVFSEALDHMSALDRGDQAAFHMSQDTLLDALRQREAYDKYAKRDAWVTTKIQPDLRGLYPKPAPKATGLKPSTKAAIAVGALGLTGAGAYAVHKHMQEKQAERDHTVTDAAVGTGLGIGAGSTYLRATRPGYSDFRKDILGEDLEKRRDRGLTRLKRNSKIEAHRAEAFTFTPHSPGVEGGFSKPTFDNKLQEQSKEIRTALKSDRSAGATAIRNALKKRGRIVLGGSAVAGGVAGYGVGHAKEASFGVFAKDTAEDLVSRSPGGVMSDLGRFKDQIVRSRDSRIEANREWRDTGKDLDRLGKISTQGLQGVGANQAALMYALNKRMGLGGKTLQEYDTIRNATRNHNVKGIYDL